MEASHTVVLIIHVLGATIIVGVAFISFVVEARNFKSKQVLDLVEYVWKIATVGLIFQLLSGIYLAASEWDKVGTNPFFWLKMLLFFALGGLVGSINRKRFDAIKKGQPEPANGLLWAKLGLLLFATIAALGVLIAESGS